MTSSLGQALTGPHGQFLVPAAIEADTTSCTTDRRATATHRFCSPEPAALTKLLEACRHVSEVVKRNTARRARAKRMRRDRLKENTPSVCPSVRPSGHGLTHSSLVIYAAASRLERGGALLTYLSRLCSLLPSLCLRSASSSSRCARDLTHLSIDVGDGKTALPPTLSLHLFDLLPLPAE